MDSIDSAQVQRIGRYTDLAVLGRGGMGIVYRGYDPELDRPVAIKVMLETNDDFVARFRREAQSIARLTHPNVVQVFDFGVDENGNPYFVMELVEGTPLDKMIAQRGRLDQATAIDVAKQAALGLGAAHRAGIIHRDVKPSNLIVDARGGVKLVDFGIARASTGQQLTQAAALMGTPGYMAPEQGQGKVVDHRADIYALGLSLFEMLAGDQPFHAEDPIALVVMNMQEPLPDLRKLVPDLPEPLVALVEKMGSKKADDRLQSADAVVRALEQIAAGDAPVFAAYGSHSVPPTNVRPLDVPRHRRPGVLVAAALAVAGIGIAVVVALLPTKHPTIVADERPVVAPVVVPPVVEKRVQPQAARPATPAGPLRVAVLKFQNVGKDPALDEMVMGLGETIVTDMNKAVNGHAKIIERADLDSDIGEIDRAKDDHFDASTVALKGKLEGVNVVVQGGFQKAGKTMRITARFVRVETGEVIDTARIDGKSRKPFELQDQISKELCTHLVALADRERDADKGTP